MIAKIYKYSIFALIFISELLLGWLLGRFFEVLIMMLCFLIAKQSYKFKYHCKSAIQCLLISIGVFVIGMRLTLPVGVSYVFAGLVGLLIAYVAQLLAQNKLIREDYEYIEPRYNDLLKQKQEIDIYTMDEPALRKYCQSKLFDDIDTEITIQRLIYHRKGKDLYEYIGYSKPQMIRREQKIEERLKIKLK